jgi:hypothetical protein
MARNKALFKMTAKRYPNSAARGIILAVQEVEIGGF